MSDAEACVFRTSQGVTKCYVASDHVESDALRALRTEDLFDILVRHRLHYDHATRTGVVLHMISAMTERVMPI